MAVNYQSNEVELKQVHEGTQKIMHFSKSLRTLGLLVISTFFAGSLVMPAQASVSVTPLYLSFESGDAYGAEVGKPAVTGSHAWGSWYPGATTAISTGTLPGSHEGQALDFIKAKTAAAWSGFTMFDSAGVSQFTDNDHPSITMDYYNSESTSTAVELKLETTKGLAGPAAYKALLAAPGWNALTFNFTTGKSWSASTLWSRVSVIPGFGSDNGLTGSNAKANDQHYYIDNVSVNGGTISDVSGSGPAPAPSPTASAKPIYVNFEIGDGYGSAIGNSVGGLGAFGNGVATIATSVSGHSDKALKFVKTSAGQPWSGALIAMGGTAVRFTNSDLKTIAFDYFSPDNVTSPVEVKIEDPTNPDIRAVAVQSAAPGWNSLTFDLSTDTSWSAAAVYSNIAIIPNYGVDAKPSVSTSVSNAGQSYYIDNISLNGGTSSDVGSPTSPSASPSASSSSNACINKPAIRLLTPDVMDATQNNNQPTWWGGASDYNDQDTMVYAHYYPVGSTITLTYQTFGSNCKAYGAGISVYLAVNAQYSGSQTSFTNTDSDGAITVIKAHASGCVPPYCAGDQTVLMQKTNAQGQVTFTLVNTNKTSPENKPTDIGQNVPGGVNALGSNLSPSFSDFTPGVNNAPATGAGGSNKASGEAIDRLLPHFVNGEGGVTAPANVTATKGTAKSLTFTVKNTSGQLVTNAAVTVTTDDGGTLTSPDSSTGTPDLVGLTTVNGTTDATGKITVVANSANTGSQNITVSYVPTTGDSSLKALNGSTKITWAAAVVKVSQTIGAVGTSVKVSKTITLPAKTNKSLTIRWTTSTPKVCSVTSGKVKGLKAGACKISGTNAGNASTNPVTKAVTITVKK